MLRAVSERKMRGHSCKPRRMRATLMKYIFDIRPNASVSGRLGDPLEYIVNPPVSLPRGGDLLKYFQCHICIP
jgi:hypothetical protein